MRTLTQPHRRYLGDDTGAILRQEIAAGRWRDWMPSERHLLGVFSISRSTLREGLKNLVAEGVLEALPRRGYRIVRKPTGPDPQSTRRLEVGVLCPERLANLPPFVGQIIDTLRTYCAEADVHLDLFEEGRLQRVRTSHLLTSLVRANPKACWLLLMAPEPAQRWFSDHRIPTLIYGHAYDGVALPSLGPDFRASVRHAAAHLMARGHRRIALVTYNPVFAGERESMAGFREAVAAHRGDAIESHLVHQTDDDPVALARAVSRLMRQKQPPTALIVCRTHHYLTVATQLTRDGWRVPEDVSLICRSDDAFLHFVRPEPATYRTDPPKVARELFRLLIKVLQRQSLPEAHVRIPPDFHPGASVGFPPGSGNPT